MWFGPPEHNTLCPRENGVVLLKLGLARVSLSLFPDRPFYSSRSGSYNESRGPTDDFEQVKPYDVGHNG
jgi:hypothetical protein